MYVADTLEDDTQISDYKDGILAYKEGIVKKSGGQQ